MSQPERILYSLVGSLVAFESCRVDTSNLLSIKGFLVIKRYFSWPFKNIEPAV